MLELYNFLPAHVSDIFSKDVQLFRPTLQLEIRDVDSRQRHLFMCSPTKQPYFDY